MNKFISVITAVAVIVALANVAAIAPVSADRDPNSHGLEVSGVAKGHGLDVSSITDLDGRLPGGGCRLQVQAQLQGERVSEVAREGEITTTD